MQKSMEMLLHEDRTASSTVHVYVCAKDAELRSWLVEELTLMSWLGPVELRCIDSLHDEAFRANELDLLLIDVDDLAPGEGQLLLTRTWTQPVIGIGTPRDDVAKQLGAVLDHAPTSVKLKQAIRNVLGHVRGSSPAIKARVTANDPGR